jgi:hypothetical protein
MATVALLLAAPAAAKTRKDPAFALPTDHAVTILVFRPDVMVGSMTTGGLAQPDADWTESARANLAAALKADPRTRGHHILFAPEQTGEAAERLADYQALFGTVAGAIVEHKYLGSRLPTKRHRFDWTLGPGVAALGDADYGLFLFTRDDYGTTGRKALQIVALGVGLAVQAGVHISYAGLVDLKTGALVWFNMELAAGGDPRTGEGAAKRVSRILETLPQPGKAGK